MSLEFHLPDGDSRDDKFIGFCGTISRAAAVLIILGSSLNLSGWLFSRGGFLQMSPYGVPMSANTAFTYILSGVSLWFLGRGDGGRTVRRIVDGCAAFVAFSGAATLGWYAMGGYSWDSAFPFSMMSPITAMAFVLAGGAILLVRRRRGGIAASLMALGVCFLGILGLMGYAFNAETLTRVKVPKHISFQSALTCVILGAGILTGMKDRGMMGFLAVKGAGSLMARRLLPPLVLVPILFGLFWHWARKIGLFEDEFGLVLMILFSMAALALVVWGNAVSLNRSHREWTRSERLRERQAQELRRTADLLEKIFSNIHLNVAILDPDFFILGVNQGFANCFLRPPDYFIGRNLFDLYPDDESEYLLRRAVEEGKPFSISAQAYVSRTDAEKGMTYLDWNLQPIKDPDGKVSELVLSLSDVTEKVRTESRLRVEEMLRVRQEGELRRTAELLEKIFSNIHLNIAYLDPGFTILRVNPSFAASMGCPAAYFIGNNLFDLYPYEDVREIFRNAVETGESFRTSSYPFVLPEPLGGRTTYWDWSLQPVREKDGRVSGLVLSLMDVTEKVQAQAELRERKEAEIQQEKMAALGMMAAGIAHEVRNPLTGLNFSLAAAENICAEEELGAEERGVLLRTFASARAASVRIGDVIRRVTDFVRPGRTVPERTNLNEAVREALELALPMLRKRGIHVEAALADDLPPCTADYRSIEQLLLNLVTNAAQAMEEWGEEKRIVVSSRKEGTFILLSVADSGPGVPEPLREKIFHPFYTTKEGGTGLGLSISRKIVADHGGAIRAGTSRFGGAEFIVSFPVCVDSGITEQG